jgi:thiamine-phosphate pyrophosphorylase
MLKIIAVTNRKLCHGGGQNFLSQIKGIALSGVDAVILREKDLPPDEYAALARSVSAICVNHGVDFIPHTFVAAVEGAKGIHLPWAAFKGAPRLPPGLAFGVSVHSPQEAAEAEREGAAWVIAGHVFATDCKKGLEARGLEFLSAASGAVKIPVYGIGGISEYNIAAVSKTGAKGVCLMSSIMASADPAGLIAKLRACLDEKAPKA